MGEVAPPAVVEALEGPVEAIARGDYAGEFFWVGLVLALWAASGYVGTFIWAADVMCEVERREPALRRIPRQLAIAVASLVSLALLTAIVAGSGPVARWVGGLLDLGDTALTLWSYGRWLLFVLVATVEFGLLYRLGPAGRAFRLRWVGVGGLVAVLLALTASLGFSVYVANFGSYDRTYGALATSIVFLVWLWLVDLMLVYGFELNLALSRPPRVSRRRPPRRRPASHDDLVQRVLDDALSARLLEARDDLAHTVSSRIVLTASQPSSLRCEIVGLRRAGSTARTASRSLDLRR